MTKQVPGLKLVIGHWSLVITLLLLTWGLRLCCLETVPPGWRDDELINIHALSDQVLRGHYPPYFAGANGHEPLYHYLHAGVHAVLGFNVLSGHLLSVAFGTLTVALTYALTRRLFGRTTAAIASLALSTSFWSLMYSRTAIRHISVPLFALATFLVIPVCQSTNYQSTRSGKLVDWEMANWVLGGLLLGVSLYTYPAARLLPVLFVLFAVYLALFHRSRFRRHWRGFLLAFAVAALAVLPLGIAVAQVAGADARISQLAGPLRELWAGNPRPLLENMWTTLGMFHATGDPEWLYNDPNRPVFNLFGGVLLWAGVALCLYRWRQPRYFFLLLWLGLGLLPAFASVPAASLSHTILAQPVAYILPSLALTEVYHWLRARNSRFAIRNPLLVICYLSFAIFLVTNAARDLRDYFIVWPQRDMVRILYRADYREAAHYLDAHTEITDVAISSALFGPWDRLALNVDVQRDDVAVRLFNPERALVWVAEGAPSTVLLTSWPRPASPIEGFLETAADPPKTISPHLVLYTIRDSQLAARNSLARFANGLELIGVRWMSEEPLVPDQEAVLLTTWLVAAPLDLPPIPIVANPPPPGVYSGPRLAIFAHLLAADGTFLVGDDGLWVDPLTLQPGDRFIQAHRFDLPPDAPTGPYVLEIGLYDPLTGERWDAMDSEGQLIGDWVLLPAVKGE